MQTLQSSSRTITLPLYAPDGLKEIIDPFISKNETLGGSLYVDRTNVRGGWEISFDVISDTEYADIRAVYDDQFANNELLLFSDPELGITDLQVFMNLPNQRLLKWNKQGIGGIVITLEPANAQFEIPEVS